MSTIVIAGGNGTIGSSIVKKFIENNFKVIVLDQFNYNLPSEVEFYQCDLTNESELSEIEKELDRSSSVTSLIWVAGGALAGEWCPLEELDIKTLKNTIELNLIAPIQFVKIFYNNLVNSHELNRSIILVSSINADHPFDLAGYSASKAGLKGFMMGELKEFSKAKIRINIVSPGTVISQKTLQETKKDWSSLLKKTAFNKFTLPEDIASMVLELTSNQSITGQVIKIDSGQSLL